MCSRDEAQRNRGRSSSFSQRPGIRFAASRLQTDGTTVFRVEDESVVTLATDAYRAGLDFADALHHASAHGCERFLTFDERGFARPAGRLKLRPIVMLPAR